MKRIASIILMFCLWCGHVTSAPIQDSIRISLLTCSPGSEIYALFGHTAIRYEKPADKIDMVFNYGMFNFNKPNFILRFVKGETDYELGMIPYIYFEKEYSSRGSYVEQQVLNLTEAEEWKLLYLLNLNYQPENRVYRYNYFYDNCTTRARDRIEESIEGEVVYPEAEAPLSFRDIIHQYTAGHEWSEFGIDFCLGAEADKPIDARLQMFAPFYMLHAADKAMIKGIDGSERPLVRETVRIIDPPKPVSEKEFPITPMQAALILLVLVLAIGGLELYRKTHYWGVDVFLFALQGVAGCVIAFLFFFSIHPTVNSNYLLILFNPIPLLYLPILIYKAVKGRSDLYYRANSIVLIFFIVFWRLIPQEFNLVILPLALILLSRSFTYEVIDLYNKGRKYRK